MNTLADNADIVMGIVSLLVLGIVVGIPQIASFFGKKKRQAEIRRRVRSTLIEETTGFSVNERLRAKRKSISPSQDLDFCELHSAEGLELPERVDGWLDLSGLTTVEGLKLPRHVGGGLDLRCLRTAEGLEFPEHMGGWLDLEGLTTVEGLKLPRHVGGDLDLKGLTTAEGLEFPEYVGGWIDLRGLTTSRGLKLPEVVVGDIYFWSLPKSEYARLSHGPPELGGEVRFEPLVDEDRMTMIRLRGGAHIQVMKKTPLALAWVQQLVPPE
jgi:hypothetical protein